MRNISMERHQSQICPGYPFCLKYNKEIAGNKFLVKNKNNKEVVLCSELKYCKAEGQYTTLYLTHKTILVSKPIGSIEKILPECFTRIHNSYIVNLHFASKIKKDGNKVEFLIDNISLPIAYRKKKETLIKVESVCSCL